MSALVTRTPFETNLRPRERQGRFPRLALRSRSSDHPLVMFAIIVGGAFASMAFVPTNGPAFATFSAPAKLNEDPRTTAKLARIAFSEADIACRGQDWTSESEDCLQRMAEESGFDPHRKVRRLANAQPLTTTPNIY